MVRLTITDEKWILNELMSCEYMGAGSSRVVYEMTTDIAEYLSQVLGYDIDANDYVIKLACGIGGQTQQNREIDAYINYGDRFDLAVIAAAGRFISIMEYVSVPDGDYECELDVLSTFWDGYGETEHFLYHYNNDFYNELVKQYDYDVPWDKIDIPEENRADFEDYNKKMAVFCSLVEIFGDTSDNAQIGFGAVSGRYVCYDYGFEAGNRTQWSSCWTSIVEGRVGGQATYIQLCIENLDSIEDLQESMNKLECLGNCLPKGRISIDVIKDLATGIENSNKN